MHQVAGKTYKGVMMIGLSIMLAGCQTGQEQTSQVSNETSSLYSSTTARARDDTYSYQIVEREVEGPSGRIFGELYLPEGVDTPPLVIFSHELGNTHQAGQAYAEFLASRGVATYIFDFSGGSIRSQSDGDTKNMSIMTEVADLEAVITASQEWNDINKQKITLMGASQGGVVSALTASRNKSQVSGLILLYPAFVIQDEIESSYQNYNDISSNPNYLGWFPMGERYAQDVWGMNFYEEIRNFDKPVLLLHGNQDWLVSSTYSQRAQEAFPNADYIEIDGAGHSFLDQTFPEVSEFIWSYLETNQLNN